MLQGGLSGKAIDGNTADMYESYYSDYKGEVYLDA